MTDPVEDLARAVAERYRIEDPLGRGGMATVHRARDLRHDRDVAFKIMRPEMAEHLGAERFRREIRLIARLRHPFILGLLDSGEVNGAFYYVMPYLPDGSLRARLDREGELPLPDALRMLREIASALEHAHAHGVVHRDLKPENVLFSSGHAQLADFGVARVVDGSGAGTALTTAGMSIGTPQYMAPEQAAGDPKTDHRADLYAFGVLAYEALSGTPPFTSASPAQLVAMHLGTEPEALSRRRTSLPPALSDLVMRCLRKRPADRWQTATELLAALRGIPGEPGSGVATVSATGPVRSRFTITEAMARRISRKWFDPRMIGDSIEYLDNREHSDVLIMLLNAVWLDGSDFEPHLRRIPYRCFVPDFYGFGSGATHRLPLSLQDHLVLLTELLRARVEESRPALVILCGFSASGDVAMLLPTLLGEDDRRVDGVLALGPNQAIETCFISRVLARLENADPDHLLEELKGIAATAPTLDDWMLLNGYLGRIVSKFRTDIRPLRSVARDIVAPFERDDTLGFATLYREATARVRRVRCIFEDTEPCHRHLKAALVAHMDRAILGERHRDGSLLMEPTPSHMALTQPDRMIGHLDELVRELRAERNA